MTHISYTRKYWWLKSCRFYRGVGKVEAGGAAAPHLLPVMTTSCHQQCLCILQFTGQMTISNCLPPHTHSLMPATPLFYSKYLSLSFSLSPPPSLPQLLLPPPPSSSSSSSTSLVPPSPPPPCSPQSLLWSSCVLQS